MKCLGCQGVVAGGRRYIEGMYVPAHFEETRLEILHALMRDHPLAAVVTLGDDGLNANHIPLELDPSTGERGTLRGHFARGNPMWKDFSKGLDALAIFQGPQIYITPSWYPEKADSGKVVPTRKIRKPDLLRRSHL